MSHYSGQRLSFQGDRCTVKWVGALSGKQGDWLGVEWDDPAKGKHDGSHEGVHYFSCKAQCAAVNFCAMRARFIRCLVVRFKSSKTTDSCLVGQNATPTAGSFIRPTRPSDPPLSLQEAVEKKYSLPSDSGESQTELVNISGKTVEEVGFEKIQRQLAALPELKIVILDALRVKGVRSTPWSFEHMQTRCKERNWLQKMKIQELDLSRNLLESWDDVLFINNSLPHLRTLRLA